MRNLYILLAVIFFDCSTSLAQERTFLFSKDNNSIKLTGDASTILLTNYVKTKEGLLERAVTMDDQVYSVSIKKTKAGKVQEIKNAQGERQATVFLGSINHYNVILPDGSELRWKELPHGKWAYTKNDKEVIRGGYVKTSANKKLIIEDLDPTSITPALQFVCMERGTDKLSAKSNVGSMIAVGVLLAVFRVALESGGSN
jgi:hypothetical protein